MIAENDFTRNLEDHRLAAVRLTCGHARLVHNIIRHDPTGWHTWCVSCGKSRVVVRELYDHRLIHYERKAVTAQTTKP